MDKEQLNRIEALLLLNSYILISKGEVGYQGSDLWASIAKQLNYLQTWLSEKKLTPHDYPEELDLSVR